MEVSHSLLVIVAELEPRLPGCRVYIPNYYSSETGYKCMAQALSSENFSLVGALPVYYSFQNGAPRSSSSCPVTSEAVVGTKTSVTESKPTWPVQPLMVEQANPHAK